MIKYEKPKLVNLSEEIMTLGALCNPLGSSATGNSGCKTGNNATGGNPACFITGISASIGCVNTGQSALTSCALGNGVT